MALSSFERKWWYWVVVGGLYGLLVRALFEMIPNAWGTPMSTAFLVATPVAVGALSVYGVRDLPLTAADWFWRPLASISLMLVGCAVTLLEGSICLVVMAPLFLVEGMIGGVLMGVMLRMWRWKTSRLKAVALLPVLLLLVEPALPLPQREQELRDAIEIAAPPERVWREIVAARAIRPDELPPSLVHTIGVPRPVEGVNLPTPQGEVRFSTWEHGVNFRGRVLEREDNRHIRWAYEFDGHSFPPGSMDEHVAIGGRYFDLRDTAFTLHPLPGGGTRLELVAHYRVSSSVNFYAVPAAQLLGHDFIACILGLYKGRSEAKV